MKVSDLVIKCLEAEGVRYVFGLPGEEIEDLLFSLQMAKRLGVGFTVVVFNDNDYGLISWKQDMSHGRSIGTRIANPDFKVYAESFGIKGARPGSVEELRVVLSEAIGSRELRLIEIPVDPRVNRELVEKLARYWSNKAPEAGKPTR